MFFIGFLVGFLSAILAAFILAGVMACNDKSWESICHKNARTER
jgi:hypothetical protein